MTVKTKNAAAPKIEAAVEKVAPKPTDLVTLQLHKDTRITERWLVNPKFNGRERWFDKTKIHGFDDTKKQVTITRAEVQHRGMESFIHKV